MNAVQPMSGKLGKSGKSGKSGKLVECSGLLVVDKPRGMTSHDVVAQVRRVLGTRSVGHAGTLDPMATGVLVVLVGSCTKLSRFLAIEDKEYVATLRLGQGTDTLDADGTSTDFAPLSPDLMDEICHVQQGELDILQRGLLARALGAELARKAQMPPAFSAIKRDGVASYVRARRGEHVTLPMRDVRVMRLQIVGAFVDPPSVRIDMRVSKGYYVRSLARDFGSALGVPAHLTELRRTRSGPFGLDGAVTLEQGAEAMRESMLSVEQAARLTFSCCTLTEQGVYRAIQGQPVSDLDFDHAPGEGVWAWFSPIGRLVAVGDRSRGRPTLLRAFLRVYGRGLMESSGSMPLEEFLVLKEL